MEFSYYYGNQADQEERSMQDEVNTKVVALSIKVGSQTARLTASALKAAMEILPSEYQNIELSRYEKMFVRHAISYDGYGFLLLNVNPTMIENESMNVVITSRGVVFFKFFEDFSDASLFGLTIASR